MPPTEGVERARGTTAALVIGDAARKLPERLTTRLDLAELWTEWTGLPFVFAVWAGRESVDRGALRDLRLAAQKGLSERTEQYAETDVCYLTERIRYQLDERALVGLRRFAALAYQAGHVSHETIQFFGPDQTERSRPSPQRHAIQGTLPVDGLVRLLSSWSHLRLAMAHEAE